MNSTEYKMAIEKAQGDGDVVLLASTMRIRTLEAALKDAKDVLETAMSCGYFPKSIKNRNTFRLINVLENSVKKAIE